jgi:hypothetical protein
MNPSRTTLAYSKIRGWQKIKTGHLNSAGAVARLQNEANRSGY